jgi:hypothetical protein
MANPQLAAVILNLLFIKILRVVGCDNPVVGDIFA